MKNCRKIAHAPIDKFSPKNSVHGESVPPVAFRTGHASAGATAEFRFAAVVAGAANISRRFVSSAFHQRNNPLRSNFVTRRSGTKLLRKGLLRWWKAELTNLRLMFAAPATTAAKRNSAVAPAEA